MMENSQKYHTTGIDREPMVSEKVEMDNRSSISDSLHPVMSAAKTRALQVNLKANENLTATYWG